MHIAEGVELLQPDIARAGDVGEGAAGSSIDRFVGANQVTGQRPVGAGRREQNVQGIVADGENDDIDADADRGCRFAQVVSVGHTR